MRPTITKLFCQVFFGQRGDFNTQVFHLYLHHDSEDKVDDLPNYVARAGQILYWSASDGDQNQYLDFHDTCNVFGSHPRTNVNCCQAILGHTHINTPLLEK